MIKKNIFKWHRVCSLIIAIPVLLWALSGFMHPIMTNVRPAVKTQSIPEEALDTGNIKLSLHDALVKNKIDTVYGVRLVHIDTNWFYQVKTGTKYNLQYISAKNGNMLSKGDWLYAQYIARIFLEGSPKSNDAKMPAMEMPTSMPESDGMDCCSEAASTVLNNKTGTAIADADLVSKFDKEYKPIYCLLPVYKIRFKRDDDIRLYVETGQDRFAVAVDKRRAGFTKFFDLVHTWEWLEFFGNGRLFMVALIAGLGFITSIMGLYLFFTTKSKKVNGNPLVKARRNHRYTALVASIFTLMFTFSGGYHALSKIGIEEKVIKCINHSFPTSAISLDLRKLSMVVSRPITNVGLVWLDNKAYWQVYQQNLATKRPAKDLMKDMSADAATVTYVDAVDYSILKSGDEIYAKKLATQLGDYAESEIVSTQKVTKFTDEYNFTDKRLPVWKVNYAANNQERLYVETSTGVLAKRTNNAKLYEGYSFALFHKHHYMDFAGKGVRDASTMIAALLQIVMVCIGLMFYFKRQSAKKKNT